MLVVVAPSPVLWYILFLATLPTTLCAEAYVKPHLDTHNKYRVRHAVDPLTVSQELNQQALKCAEYYIEKKVIDHSCPHKSTTKYPQLGENLYLQTGTITMKPVQHSVVSVDMWYDEIQIYDWDNPSVERGKSPGQVGHFTQLVWKTSKEMGVGILVRSDVAVVATLYGPPGNWKGLERENVLPKRGNNGSDHPGTAHASEPSTKGWSLRAFFSIILTGLVMTARTFASI